MRHGTRIVAVAIVAVLFVGAPGVCSGWAATAEARMACCVEGSACAMHPTDGHGAPAPSQSEADSCCAASERGGSTPSAKAFVAVVSLDLAVSPVVAGVPPTRALFDLWHVPAPLDTSQVPKHLLLSVFLI